MSEEKSYHIWLQESELKRIYALLDGDHVTWPNPKIDKAIMASIDEQKTAQDAPGNQ